MECRVNPQLAAELNRFQESTVNISKCFNCGTCSAICSHATGEYGFPRRMIRYAQLGLEQRLLESPEPWLCYYCGVCSRTCPRDADPAELMMTLRRWLTSRYDWTGISRRLYLSTAWEIGLLTGAALLVLALFIVPGLLGVPFGFAALSADATRHVRLDQFAPKVWIHVADWTLAGILLAMLSVNAVRMIYFVRRGMTGRRIPIWRWFTQAPHLLLHGLTQRRWLECEEGVGWRWLLHLALVSGYATMFLLVVLFLPAFQRDGADFHYTAIFGYYASAALLGVTVVFMRDRLRKEQRVARHSHVTDWMFLLLLFSTALSGLLLHLARLLDLAWPTYILYVVHLMIAVPMLVVEVPFGKWLHLVFRPVSEYLVAVARPGRAPARESAPVPVKVLYS